MVRRLELQKNSILFKSVNITKHGNTNRPNVSITLEFKEYNIICSKKAKIPYNFYLI